MGVKTPVLLTARRREARHRPASGAWEAGKGKSRDWRVAPACAAFPDPKLFRFGSNRADALALSDGYPTAPPASDATIRTIASLTLR